MSTPDPAIVAHPADNTKPDSLVALQSFKIRCAECADEFGEHLPDCPGVIAAGYDAPGLGAFSSTVSPRSAPTSASTRTPSPRSGSTSCSARSNCSSKTAASSAWTIFRPSATDPAQHGTAGPERALRRLVSSELQS